MTDPTDPFTGEGWEAYAQDIRDNLIPKIDDSAIVVSLAPADLVGDVKFAVELGFTIMLNKPLILHVASQGMVDRLPPKLLSVADRIIVADITTTVGQDTLGEAIRDLLD